MPAGEGGGLTWKRQRGEARKTRTTRLCDRDVVVSLVPLGLLIFEEHGSKWKMLEMNYLNHLLLQNIFWGVLPCWFIGSTRFADLGPK